MYDQNQKPTASTPPNAPNAFPCPPYPPYPPQTPRYAPPAPKRKKPTYTMRELVFALVFIAVGLFFALAMPFRVRPLAVMLLMLVLFAETALFFGKETFRLKGYSTVLLGFYTLFSLVFLTNANAVLRFFTFVVMLALLALFWYTLAVLRNGALAEREVFGALKAAISAYFVGFHLLFAVIVSSASRGERARKGWRTVGFIAVGLAVAFIPTMIVGLLLSYDASFTAIFERLFDLSLDSFFERLWDCIVAILLGACFFSLVMTLKRASPRKAESATQGGMPRAILYAALTPMLILYAIFFFSQKDYYLSAFTKLLPEGLTYAAYAREGFFQLCAVACINFAAFVAFSLLVRKKEGERELLCRIYQGILAFFTLVLIATALSKMALYIGAYGLTEKRVYASWAMLLLAFVFLMILVKQLLSRFPFFKVAIVGALLLFALIALPNTDAVIADYNVDRYLDGSLETVDVDELVDLGVASVEARIRLEAEWRSRLGLLGTGALSPDERAALETLSCSLDAEKESLSRGLWSFSFPNARAKRLLEEREVV